MPAQAPVSINLGLEDISVGSGSTEPSNELTIHASRLIGAFNFHALAGYQHPHTIGKSRLSTCVLAPTGTTCWLRDADYFDTLHELRGE